MTIAPLVILCVVLGLAVGSFLNVVIYRVPERRSVVRPRSACPACGEPISPRDNIPVLSWVVLRRRARCCGAPISVRYPLVEAGTAVAFGGVALWRGYDAALPAFLYLAAISIALAVIDLDVRRLPDVIVLPSYPVAAVLLAVPALVDGSPAVAVRAAVGGAALFALFFALWFFSLLLLRKEAMGLGDVKLSGVLGMYLGWLSWAHLVVGGFLGFMVGGLVGVALMAVGRVGRKSMVPYGPSMLVGAWLAVPFARPIADWYLGAAGF
ncbi:MAG: prepilin peptidase [Actinomycetales bacterium]|nr:prepilin peptidase [Actinomycetales bacterium]